MSSQEFPDMVFRISANLSAGGINVVIREYPARLTGKTYTLYDNRRVKLTAMMVADTIHNELYPSRFTYCASEEQLEQAQELVVSELKQACAKLQEKVSRLCASAAGPTSTTRRILE
jgi:hypothetical protein